MDYQTLIWVLLHIALKSRVSGQGYVTYSITTSLIEDEEYKESEKLINEIAYSKWNDLPYGDDFRNGDDFFDAVADDLDESPSFDSDYEYFIEEDELQFSS